MSAEQELAAAREQLAQLQRNDRERTMAAAVAREVSKHDVVSPAAAQQLCDLILPAVQATPVSDGRVLIHGQDYKPVESVVADFMKQPGAAHFLRSKENPATAPPAAGTQAAAPAVPAAGQLRPGQMLGSMLGTAAREALPGESLGAAMIRVGQAQKGPQGDPRLDPGQAFGIGRRPQPK